jgi:hypothetical protein
MISLIFLIGRLAIAAIMLGQEEVLCTSIIAKNPKQKGLAKRRRPA